VEDGKGQPLGRSFRVKLWPTLIFLQDGREVARLVRPADSSSISRALGQIVHPALIWACRRPPIRGQSASGYKRGHWRV
jgi:thioredoxin-like negative regulator of GroEL